MRMTEIMASSWKEVSAAMIGLAESCKESCLHIIYGKGKKEFRLFKFA